VDVAPGSALAALGRDGVYPVPGCGDRIDPSRLMCRSHWSAVPWELRARVWATWRSGCGTCSSGHRRAVRAAVTVCQAVRPAA
jgi:hypothetical protein